MAKNNRGVLIEWDTPFKTFHFPSVTVYVQKNFGAVEIYVEGDDKWKVSFENIVGIKVCEEEYDNNTRFHVHRPDGDFSSCIWENSDWLKDFGADRAEVIEGLPLRHYVIFGGDHNVEVLALGGVEFSQEIE